MKNKRFTAILAVAALGCALALPAGAASPTVDPSTCVNDYAGVLSQETEDYVTGLTVQLQESCGAQIGVYTVDHIGNTDLEEYAYQVFNTWGLGDADKDNGVLLLLTPGDDDYICLQGEGLETTLNSSTLGNILADEMEPSWLKADYDTGTKQTVRALAEKLAGIYNVSISLDGSTSGTAYDNGGAVYEQPPQKGGSGMGIFVLVLVLIVALILISRPRRGPRGGGPRFIFVPTPRRRRGPPPPPPGGFGGPGMGGPGMGGRRTPPPRGGGFGGPGMGGPRPGGMGGSRPSSGGGFRAGGGGTRGGGASRRH